MDRLVMRKHQTATQALEVREKHPLAIRWFHWLNFPVLFVMIWSGMLIYWAHEVFTVTIAGRELFHVLPSDILERLGFGSRLAEGMSWHFFFMWIFSINGLLYVLYTAISGEWRYILPDRGSFKESILVVLHDLRIYKGPLAEGKFNGAQRIAYTMVIVMGFGSLVTGLAIYKPMQLSPLTQFLGGYTVCRFLHFWLMIGFLGFFVVHVLQVIRAGWNNFRAMVTGKELAPIETEVTA